MNALKSTATCWACAEALPRGAAKCAACGELQRDPATTCWACAEERPRGAMRCPRCGESPCAPAASTPASSLVYLLVLPFLFAIFGHQLGVGAPLGAIVGFLGWVVAVVRGARP